jgi:hypothetical protein
MKFKLALGLLSLLFVSATFAQSTATFVGQSTTNTFGADGSYIPLITTTHPTYATVTPSSNILTWTWPNGVTTWYSGTGSFILTVNIAGGATHMVTLYMLDYGPANRAQTINVQDAASGAILSTESVSNFSQGIYYSWLISGNVNFVVQLTGGLNPVVSGVFFDPPASTGTCAVRTHVVDLTWSAVSGATSYDIYKNGTLLGTSTTTSYSDSAVSGGATITYGISAVVNGSQTQVTSSTITVPSP